MTATTERCEQSYMAGSICTLLAGHSGPHQTFCACGADMNADEHAPGCEHAGDPEEALVNAPWITEARKAMEDDALGHALWRLRGAIADAEGALERCISADSHDHQGSTCPVHELSDPERNIARIGLRLCRDALGMVDAAVGTTP